MGKDLREKLQKAWDIFLAVGSFIFIVTGIVYISYGPIKEYVIDDFEIITWDGSIIILGCRYPLGPLFNKDSIEFTSQGFNINECSLFNEKTTYMPFYKVKKVIISNGLYWKSFRIEWNGFWGRDPTIYFKKEETKELIRNFLASTAPSLIVIEKRTFLNKAWGLLRRLAKNYDIEIAMT
jgi:hypothetical protein